MSERWEKDRGSWVLARAGHRPAARRRGEKLMVATRRYDRYEVGAGDTPFSEVTTRGVFYRSVMREEGAANIAGWVCFTVIWMFVLAIVAGPALLVSRIAYCIWWAMSPKWGRMSPLPYLGIAALLGSVTWLTLGRLSLEGTELFLTQYAAVQVVLGVAWAAWLVRANGWAAVARREKQSGKKVNPIVVEIPNEAPLEPVQGNVPASEEEPSRPEEVSESTSYAEDIEPIEIEVEIEDIEPETSSPR